MEQLWHYFSIQYSAIQKTVLRHNRLWSMAGISAILSKLNEIEMPRIARAHGGEPLLAGGGKFTARFSSDHKAEDARDDITKAVATTLPMLEYQVSDVITAASLKEARDKGLLRQLREQKKALRGYGVTFNPHLKRCIECKEYPAVRGTHSLCAVCAMAHAEARAYEEHMRKEVPKITLDRIYDLYLDTIEHPEGAKADTKPKIPLDFDNLFPRKSKAQGQDSAATSEINRMAVWFSDLNSMKDKVTLWANQDDGRIKKTFDDVKDINVQIITNALINTFPTIPDNNYIPFRLIVAGGDDLCLVMDAKYILDFALNLSTALNEALDKLPKNHPLRIENLSELKKQLTDANPKLKNKNLDVDAPFCFGASFIIASVHTPFSKIHAAGEHLMGLAKKKSRRANSLYWSVMPELTQAHDHEMQPERELFDKPLFIDKHSAEASEAANGRLALRDYAELSEKCGRISGAHRAQVARILTQLNRAYPKNKAIQSQELAQWLETATATGLAKDFEFLITEKQLYESHAGGRRLSPKRVATLLEYMSLTD